jgi:penicillin amidase
VPHIYASCLYDAYFAQGFVHAKDRLWQMVSMRALTEGKLSALIGATALKADSFTRTLGWVQLAEAELKLMKQESQQGNADSQGLLEMQQAYCDGVNHYLAKCVSGTDPARLPAEFYMLSLGLAPTQPAPWRPIHLLLINRLMALQMSSGWQHQVVRQMLAEVLGEEKAAMWCEGRDRQASTPFHLEQPFEVNLVTQLIATLDAHPKDHFPDGQQGSNWWVVSGEHTKSGMPLLANDPHLGVSVPCIWYENHLHVQSPTASASNSSSNSSSNSNGSSDADGVLLSVTGVTLPGLAGVVIGHNEHVGWGITLGFADCEDVYLERIYSTRCVQLSITFVIVHLLLVYSCFIINIVIISPLPRARSLIPPSPACPPLQWR